MNIHEYEAKSILKRYGAPVLKGVIAFNSQDMEKGIKELGDFPLVVKAQIHAGGRGKGGGVKVVKDAASLTTEFNRILGMTLVTPQTGKEGKLVKRVYIEQGCKIKSENYLSLLVDRATSKVIIIASASGGMDIEEVSATHPEKIMQLVIEPVTGIMPFHGRKVGSFLGLEGNALKQIGGLLKSLYQAFVDTDAALLEINPLVVTEAGDLVCLDAKMNFDSNALYRHPEILALKDENEEDPSELEAQKYDLNYIKLSGTIGCMVNGAGLAMATMDVIKLYKHDPANFLDVGGGATQEKVTRAFKIILSDKNVKGILVNIFGGIMRCDIIANGIIEAAKEVKISVPLVVRLEGTNKKEGQALLASSGLKIEQADNLNDAALKIVKQVEGR